MSYRKRYRDGETRVSPQRAYMSLSPWKEKEPGGYVRGHWQEVNRAATCQQLPTAAEAAARSQEGEAGERDRRVRERGEHSERQAEVGATPCPLTLTRRPLDSAPARGPQLPPTGWHETPLRRVHVLPSSRRCGLGHTEPAPGTPARVRGSHTTYSAVSGELPSLNSSRAQAG